MKKIFFAAFRTVSRALHQTGLRNIHFVNKTYLRLIRMLRPQWVVFAGHKMFLDPDDCLRLSWQKEYEPVETKLVKETVKNGSVVLDIGAHIGYYTLLFAKRVGPHGKIYAFEPDPTNFALLKKNVEANHYQNVVLVNKAVSDKTGKGTLYLSQYASGDHRTYARPGRKSVPVKTAKIDEVVKEKVDFVKMDVQGAEAKALAGMQNVLKKSPHVKLLMEFWPKGLRGHGNDPEEMLKTLQRVGFTFSMPNKNDVFEKAPLRKILQDAEKTAPNVFCTRKNHVVTKK